MKHTSISPQPTVPPSHDAEPLPAGEPFATMVRVGLPTLRGEVARLQSRGYALGDLVGALTLASKDGVHFECEVSLQSRAKALEAFRAYHGGRVRPGASRPSEAARATIPAALQRMRNAPAAGLLRVAIVVPERVVVVDLDPAQPPAAPPAPTADDLLRRT